MCLKLSELNVEIIIGMMLWLHCNTLWWSKHHITIELSVKSWPIGPELQPLIWCFIPSFVPGCCPQNHEFLLNIGMKYWDSGLNVPGSRTFIATLPIAATVMGWKRSWKERTGQTQFSTKLSFMPPWNPVYFIFSSVFWNLVPYVTKQGSGVVFAWLYR